MKYTYYEIEVPEGDGRYRVEFCKDKGKILSFMVQLEYKAGDDWRPVVRYDTAHGFAHRDRYKPDGTKIAHEPLGMTDYNQALDYAIDDVKDNDATWLAPFRGLQP